VKYRIDRRPSGIWLSRPRCVCEMRTSDERLNPCFPHFGADLYGSLCYLRRAVKHFRKARH
jgi:hypothetical protein